MIAGSIGICGAWTGSTVPGDRASNPKGFFEHVIIREHVIKKLLTHIGCDPLGVRKLPPIHLQGEPPGLVNYIKSIIESDGYKNDRPWLYKDAKLTLLWPYFMKGFPDAKWLVVKRDEEGFINSCLNTHFMKQHSEDRAFWVKFANEYRIRIEALKDTHANVLEISSPDVIAGDFPALETVISKLGLTYNEHKLREFISPNYWHANSNKATGQDT